MQKGRREMHTKGGFCVTGEEKRRERALSAGGTSWGSAPVKFKSGHGKQAKHLACQVVRHVGSWNNR